MVLHSRLSSEGRQRRIYTKRASGPPKTINNKKYKNILVIMELIITTPFDRALKVRYPMLLRAFVFT
jgi:hypothetical protein